MEAVKGRVEVYLDGGVRQGTDVLKALALGAKAVFIGRPVLWGLSYQVCHSLYWIIVSAAVKCGGLFMVITYWIAMCSFDVTDTLVTSYTINLAFE